MRTLNIPPRRRGSRKADPSTFSLEDCDSPAELIWERVSRELDSMGDLLRGQPDRRVLDALACWTRSTVERIGCLASRGGILPSAAARWSQAVRAGAPVVRPWRLGVFPIAANPVHWLHIAAGLAAMESCRLDNVHVVVAGRDPRKPRLAPEPFRHRTARRLLELFAPWLEYSPVALGGDSDGEENLFRILGSNPRTPIHAFYIAGSDHYHPRSPSCPPDTIEKLEEGVRTRACGFNPRFHRLSVIFLDRGGFVQSVPTFLDVLWVRILPLQASSTRIRRALTGEGPVSDLAFLPASVYHDIRAEGLYSAAPPVAPSSFGTTPDSCLYPPWT